MYSGMKKKLTMFGGVSEQKGVLKLTKVPRMSVNDLFL